MPIQQGFLEHLADIVGTGFGGMIIFFPIVYVSFKRKYKFTIRESHIFTEFLVSVILLGLYSTTIGKVKLSGNLDEFKSMAQTLMAPLIVSYIVIRFFERNNIKNKNGIAESINIPTAPQSDKTT